MRSDKVISKQVSILAMCLCPWAAAINLSCTENAVALKLLALVLDSYSGSTLASQ
jgi:hypothetical protein